VSVLGIVLETLLRHSLPVEYTTIFPATFDVVALPWHFLCRARSEDNDWKGMAGGGGGRLRPTP
jgi:hypothetical protein